MPASRPSPVEPAAHGPGDEPVGPPAGPVPRSGDHDRSRTVAGTDERAIVRLLASGRLHALHALLAERGRDDLLASGPGNLEAHRASRDRAVAELLGCGLVDEVHTTRGLAAGVTAVGLEEEIVESYDLLLDARAALADDAESIWPSLLDTYVAVTAFEVGDLRAALDALDRIERSPDRPARIRVVAAYGRAFFRLVTGGVSPHTLAGVDRALGEVRRSDPRTAQAWHGHLAKTLADLGHPACARFARLEAGLPAGGTRHRLEREVLRLRASTLGGDAPSLPEAMAVLEQLDGIGHRRASGRSALRLAHDLARAGELGTAHRLHAWGLDRVPSGTWATRWESWWARPVGGGRAALGPRAPLALARVTAPAAPGVTSGPGLDASPDAESPLGPDAGRTVEGRRRPSGLDLRVMAPAIELTADGAAVVLTAAQAKLLLGLVLAHPGPLNVEQVSELLWPGEPLSATRHRLNSLVHRLRRALGEHGDALVRTGDLLQLDADRCGADLWRFRTGLAGEAAARRHALVSVRGNLCDAQFPYEDRFVYERHRICAEWLRRAREMLQVGELRLADLDASLAALDLSHDDL